MTDCKGVLLTALLGRPRSHVPKRTDDGRRCGEGEFQLYRRKRDGARDPGGAGAADDQPGGAEDAGEAGERCAQAAERGLRSGRGTDAWQAGAGEVSKRLYPVNVAAATMAGVPVRVVTPLQTPAANEDKVLMNIHGGGFVVGLGVTDREHPDCEPDEDEGRVGAVPDGTRASISCGGG